MKLPKNSKQAFVTIAVSLLFVFNSAIAVEPEPSPTPERRSYSLSDFNNFMSTFFKIPSTFSWDNAPKYQSSPARTVDLSVPIPTPISVNPPASPPACLGLAADGSPLTPLANIYDGTCFSGSPSIPYITSVGYEGTLCPAGQYLFRVHYVPSSGSGVLENVTATVATGIQGTLASISCFNLKKADGTNLSIPDKPLSGAATYLCQAGVWRLISISCSDYEVMCPGGTYAFSYTAADASVYPVSLTMTTSKVGVLGPSISCNSLGSAGTGLVWASGGLSTYCDGVGNWQTSGACIKGPEFNNTYPNCVGPGTTYVVDYMKPGINACLNADSTKYFWMLVSGTAPTICADPTGC